MNAYLLPDAPSDWEAAFDQGFDCFCERCVPDKLWYIRFADGGGEADWPEHCAECDEPLENPLTSSGVEYVLDAIRQSLQEPRSERDRVHPGSSNSFYHGARRCDVVRDWAMQLLDYDLTDRQERIVWHFLERTAADRSARCGITHWPASSIDDGASI